MKMFSIKYITNMFYLILLLQHSSYILQDCEATEMDIIAVTSSPILKHIIRTGIRDSDVKVTQTVPKTEVLNKELENYNNEFHKDVEIIQKVKDSGINSTTDILNVKQDDGKEDVVSNNATTDVSKLVYSKLAIALKTRLHHMIAKAFSKHIMKSNSFEVDSNTTSEPSSNTTSEVHAAYISNSSKKKSEAIPRSHSNEKSPTGRQFVFHPYLPYGKDVAPDEKISIGDVLPVKMVKFFKGMVEEAPWEQMFMKMVRMIVDQFVDKIIEKMFAHKDDDHDEWRSSDGGSAKSDWSLPKNVLTYLVRSRRSTEGKAKSERVQDWVEKDLSTANRVSKEDRSKPKEATQEESWIDSILDYLFPDDPKAADGSEKDQRNRRDVNQPLQEGSKQISGIMRSFLARYLKFQTEQLSPESVNAIVKDSIRHKTSEVISQVNEDSEVPVGASSSEPKNTDTSLDPKLTDSVYAQSTPPLRTRRSTSDDTEKDKEEDRLWQAGSRRTRPSNRKSREDCSLRRACNAGRLLSRLPSVQDITMQLKAYGNEPHWDALLWGMSKKRCSRIFCKRQRSPKGTKHHWDGPEKRFLRKSTPSSRSSRLRHDESDLTTIYPV
ncbi:unnamed protein product [Larinioides sclopetarius]|uniref:Uncharacterized protein n=1 Tax=Larinioides sclopetarius TaxID=280406 RepID=A0AAV1YTQ2_9ARAC